MRRAWVLAALLPMAAVADPVVIEGVPAYQWTDGCVPTAAAEILAFWNSHGYAGMTPGATNQTSSVVPVINQLAADFHTDASGTTDFQYVFPGLKSYAKQQGYGMDTGGIGTTLSTMWEIFESEINAGRPVLLTVTPWGDSRIHAVAAYGYDMRADGLWYAYHDTWNEQEETLWSAFQPALSGVDWGASAECWIRPTPLVLNPEPGFLGVGMLLLVYGALQRERSRRRGAATPTANYQPYVV